MKCFILLFSCLLFACSANSQPQYNPQEFKTSNYQKNIDNAVDTADLLRDFDQSHIPSVNVDSQDISELVQADLYYNQGNYLKAYPFYNLLALKYKDPRVIYKAIICLEHISSTPIQVKDLDSLINLFIATDSNSKLSKLFQIKVSIKNINLKLAESNLDFLLAKDPDKRRVILLLISSMISSDMPDVSYPTLNSFAKYTIDKYTEYPEAHLLAILAYSMTNNEVGLSKEVNYINKVYPNWYIPLYWSSDILMRHKQITTLLKILPPLVQIPNPDKVLQNIYVAALLNSGQNVKAQTYLTSEINGANHDNVLIDLGIISTQNGEYTNAFKYFNQAKVDDKAVSQVLALVKGAIYDYEGQTANAVKEYQLITNTTILSISNIMLLNAYLDQGNYMAVDNILNGFAKNNQMNDEQTILFKASYYLGAGKYQLGYNLMKSKFYLYGKDPGYLYQYAGLSGMMNYTKQAISLYKEYLKRAPKEAYAYNDLAYIYADQAHDYQKAQKYAEIAYKMAPTDPNVLDTVGWVYYKLDLYTKALPYTRTSYEMNYDPETGKHLVRIYLALGRPDLAKSVILFTKEQVEQQLKLQLIKKAVSLLSYLQFGIEVK